MSSKRTVDISVHMITYNHEEYIKEAIEGVLLQKCEYSIELVIGEDCGTDNTRRICEQYAEKFPDIIRLLPSDKNLGIQKNFFRTYEACKGEYIAFCEGDDYWIDPNKLQLQADFLKRNEDYAGVAHNANKHFEEWNTPYSISEAQKKNEPFEKLKGIHGTFNGNRKEGDVSFMEILDFWPIQTGTFMCLNISLKDYPSFIYDTKHVDAMMFFTVFKHGKIRYLDCVYSNYRIHQQGATNNLNGTEYYLNKIETYLSLNNFFESKYYKIFKDRIVNLKIQVAIEARNRKERINYLFGAIKQSPLIIFSKTRIVLSLLKKSIFNG